MPLFALLSMKTSQVGNWTLSWTVLNWEVHMFNYSKGIYDLTKRNKKDYKRTEDTMIWVQTGRSEVPQEMEKKYLMENQSACNATAWISGWNGNPFGNGNSNVTKIQFCLMNWSCTLIQWDPLDLNNNKEPAKNLIVLWDGTGRPQTGETAMRSFVQTSQLQLKREYMNVSMRNTATGEKKPIFKADWLKYPSDIKTDI